MAKAQIILGEVGGSGGITANLNDLLGSITTEGGSYTTTQDCIMIGSTKGNGSQTPILYIDGTSNILYQGDSSTYTRGFGYNDIGIAIPSGHTISTRVGTDGAFTYNINFYSIA